MLHKCLIASLISPTYSGDRGPPLINHCNSLRQQQLGFGYNCEDAQDVQGITHCIAPTGQKNHHITDRLQKGGNLAKILFFGGGRRGGMGITICSTPAIVCPPITGN